MLQELLGGVAAVLVLAVAAPAWHLAGRAAQRLHLPAITGMMLAGVATGPQALGLLSPGSLARLAPLQHLCLSLIALSAGAELHLPELQRLRRQVACLTAAIAAASWLLVYACMRLLAGSLPFMQPLAPGDVAAVCTLAATLAVARSPASAIAVLKEVDGRGPFCSLVMAVVVVKDVLLFAAFAVNVELYKAAGGAAGATSPLALLLGPLTGIVFSAALGSGAGYLLARLLVMRTSSIVSIAAAVAQPAGEVQLHGGGGAKAAALRVLRHPAVARLRPALPLLLSGLAFGLAELGGAEPLLACVAAGLLAANWRGGSQQGRAAAEQLSGDLARLAPPVNSVFFGLVGASLRLAAVRDTLWAAAILYCVRLAAIWLGCWAGARLGAIPPDVARPLWMGMVTQAGIALGLAQAVAARYPDWGPEFAALMAGAVVMNLLSGPPLFKAAVSAAGEARAAASLGLPLELPHRSGRRDAGAEGGKLRRSSSTGGVGAGRLLPQLPTIPIIEQQGPPERPATTRV